MILSAGLNVKIVIFPQGEDPDSYSHKLSTEDFKSYIDENQNDFITFKANLLLEKTKNDPINVSNTINDIISSISVIPDAVSRSVYIKTTAQIFEMDEQLLILEVQKKLKSKTSSKEESSVVSSVNTPSLTGKKFQKGIKHELNLQEKDLIRLMLNYGALSIPLEVQKEDGEIFEEEYPLAQFIIEEMLTDNLIYSNKSYQHIFDEFIDGLENGLLVNDQHFVQNPNLTSIVADLTTSENIVSENWKVKHQIHTKMESDRLKQAAVESVFIYKLRVTENLIIDKQQSLKLTDIQKEEDLIIEEIQELIKVRNIFAKELGIIITQ
jgi:DNA primase